VEALITLLSVLSFFSGIALFFAAGTGAFLAGLVCVTAGGLALAKTSFTPLIIGFSCLWLLRLMGFEKK
jgi:uncharacterized membrane protein YbhN (UPF0104 family)